MMAALATPHRKGLRGILIAPVTPLRPDESLDLPGLHTLIGHFIASGAHGLFILASQGEFFSLDRSERQRVARTAVRAAGGRVPVIVNTGAMPTSEAVRLSRDAEAAGADALGVITPFYMKPTAEELFQHYWAILRAVRCPVYAYNNPPRSGVGMDARTVVRLAKASPRFRGIFDANGDLGLARRCRQLQDGHFEYFLAGRMELIEALRAGARGAVLATANAAPREFVSWYEAVRRGERVEAERLHRHLTPLHTFFRTGPFPATMKACLELQGLPAGPARRPALPLPSSLRGKAVKILRRLEASGRRRRGS